MKTSYLTRYIYIFTCGCIFGLIILKMRAQKSNFTVYSSSQKVSGYSRTTNIIDLIQQNKKEEKREKLIKFYTIFGSLALLLIIATFLYL